MLEVINTIISHNSELKMWELDQLLTYNCPYLQHIQRSQSSKVHLQEVNSFQAVAVHIRNTCEHSTAKLKMKKQKKGN